MTFKTLAAAALAMTMAAPALAVPVEVDLIIDPVGSDSMTTLTLFGLDNGISGDQVATSFSIQTAFDFYGPFAYINYESFLTVNSFTFIPDGNFAFDNLVLVRFEVIGFMPGNNDAPNFNREIYRINCNGDEGGIACFYGETALVVTPEGNIGGTSDYIGFADVVVREVVAPVPLPAACARSGPRKRLRRRTILGVTSTSSSSSI
jgi:hypothetical protein